MTACLQLLCALLSLVAMATPEMVEDVDPGDLEVQACVSFALESFNFFSQDPHLYKVTKFYSVKRTNIGGGQYDMDVEVKKTQCLKGPTDVNPCHAPTSTETQVFRCHFVVLSVPWKKQRVLLQSSCTPVTNSAPDLL